MPRAAGSVGVGRRLPTPALLAAAPSRSQSPSHAWFAFFPTIFEGERLLAVYTFLALRKEGGWEYPLN